MRRRFVTLDVFTDRRFAGNPLAVVLEPEGLDTAAMQAIAREFNLSETVFVLPPREARHRASLRIFPRPGAALRRAPDGRHRRAAGAAGPDPGRRPGFRPGGGDRDRPLRGRDPGGRDRRTG